MDKKGLFYIKGKMGVSGGLFFFFYLLINNIYTNSQKSRPSRLSKNYCTLPVYTNSICDADKIAQPSLHMA